MWTIAGWKGVADYLERRGLRVVLTGSDDPEEIAYLKTLSAELSKTTFNAGGKLSLCQAAYLIHAAKIYVGPDTAMTHIAAAVGTPTIALYGPSNPVKWGPWPKNYSLPQNPWRRLGTQRVENVNLIQGKNACVPCLLEGCGRNTASYSDCLQQLPKQTVISAIEKTLDQTKL